MSLGPGRGDHQLGSVQALITKLLIANRGEIAVRIASTASALGVETVAVYTDPDRGALHTRACDLAVSVDDYLSVEAIIGAAQRVGADAIHPGFGFLAENADFAQAVKDAGLIWVGPPPDAITSMGSKAGARALMAEAGVPVLPGYDGDDQDDGTLAVKAREIGWPVIIKASAGGGGKGMQVVESEEQFLPSLAEARRLALSAFGDDRMVLEKYLARARHIEVQVMADAHGQCIHLWERECSIQRRHQKVIEEAPSPAFEGTDGQTKRETLCRHAVQAAKAVDYEGAGTVEFVVDEEGNAYFLEMNTRIQVEHPVTECITGFDIVALQLSVAAGERLDVRQEDVSVCGWAMEARIYAEDPDNGYLPSTGVLHRWEAPSGPGVRVDAGVETGSEVTVHYDPMLAKVIVHAASRDAAVRRLDGALRNLVALGVVTNRDHLRRVLQHPSYRQADLHTRFLDVHADALGPAEGAERAAMEAMQAAVIADWLRRPQRRLPGLQANWRSNRWRGAEFEVSVGEHQATVVLQPMGDGLLVDGELTRCDVDAAGTLRVERAGVVQTHWVDRVGSVSWVRTPSGAFKVEHAPRFVVPGLDEGGGGCTASMPGKIIQVLVSEGDSVTKGQALVVMEAMKMEQTMTAPADGVVAGVRVAEGDQVDAGAALIVIDESD